VFAIGTLPPALVGAHEAMLAVQAVIAEEASAGICCDDIYRKALVEIHNYGLAGHFMGPGFDQAIFVGHGIGLEIDELPILGKDQTMTLKKT